MTLTTGAFLFLLLRLFAVSGYQWHTAFAVLHTIDLDDSIGIVLGTVMADPVVAAVLLAVLLPAFLFRVVGGFLLAVRIRRGGATGLPEGVRGSGGLDIAGLVLLAIVVAGVTAYIMSFRAWWLPLVSLLVMAAMFGIGALARRDHGQVGAASRWAGRHVVGLVVGLAVVGLLVSAAVVRTPWMPLERVEVKGERAPLVGYVLEAEPGFLKFMTDEGRDFLILNEGEVESREEIVDH
ncbi:hypothetical protein ACH4SP_20045 [Streptomyces sp. NPDC021093]|uniref:hypothetical protein n=1 Tax=Streptomyces sp. NPDC021093 TaxID=3365112 RepID=UPI0037B9D57B